MATYCSILVKAQYVQRLAFGPAVVLSALFFHQSRQGIKKRHEFGNEHVRVAAKQYLHH
jgi:hypothetical protein